MNSIKSHKNKYLIKFETYSKKINIRFSTLVRLSKWVRDMYVKLSYKLHNDKQSVHIKAYMSVCPKCVVSCTYETPRYYLSHNFQVVTS